MADTFDSRLKLRLQESGANSGQWGTLLNQTITNIASVFGFGTHQLTSDADATLTLSDDGASVDALKSSYLKITSSVSLTATRTLTFAPNTLNQVKYIENATSGSQSITISQGSGANVTIASGKTAVVYFDGAGSGAAVVDALAGVDPGVTDTLAEVLSAGNATGGTDIAVGTGDNITFADSSKAIFGAGSDLSIFHNGTTSVIEDSGTGNLQLRTSTLAVVNAAGTEVILQGVEDGAVSLYHNAGVKLATTSSGIDVTGSVTADGLTVETGTDPASITLRHTGNTSGLILKNFNGNEAQLVNVDNGPFVFKTNDAEVMRLSGTNVGIGTSSPDTLLELVGADPILTVRDSDTSSGTANATLRLAESGASDTLDAYWDIKAVGGQLQFIDNWNEGGGTGTRVVIDDSGKVGIGTSSPAALIHGMAGDLFLTANSTAADSGQGVYFQSTTSGWTTASAHAAIFGKRTDASNGYLRFDTRQSGTTQEAMRISGGNLLVGTTNANPTSSSVNDAGVELSDTGGVRSTVASNPAATFNRKTDDGDIVLFRKDGSTVGAINTNAGALVLKGASTTAPVQLQTHDGNEDIEVDPDGFIKFETAGSERLRIDADGIKFHGDTAAANGLDDYEEGVFQTTWTASGGGTITLNSSYDDMIYTKIGRQVTVTGYFQVSSVSSPSGVLQITLPFASVNQLSYRSSVSLSFNGLGAGAVNDAWGIIDHNQTSLNVYLGTGSGVTSFANRVVASTDLRLTATYTAA